MVSSFDQSKALEQVGGDKAFLVEVIDAFLDDCPVLLNEIDGAILKKEAETLRRAAHTLKGSAEVLAAAETKSAALLLEYLGRNAQWDQVPKSTAALKHALAELLPELRAFTQP